MSDGLRLPRMVVGAKHVVAAYRVAKASGRAPKSISEVLEVLEREGVLVVGGFRLLAGEELRLYDEEEEEYAELGIVKELVKIISEHASL